HGPRQPVDGGRGADRAAGGVADDGDGLPAVEPEALRGQGPEGPPGPGDAAPRAARHSEIGRASLVRRLCERQLPPPGAGRGADAGAGHAASAEQLRRVVPDAGGKGGADGGGGGVRSRVSVRQAESRPWLPEPWRMSLQATGPELGSSFVPNPQ